MEHPRTYHPDVMISPLGLNESLLAVFIVALPLSEELLTTLIATMGGLEYSRDGELVTGVSKSLELISS